MSRPGNTNRTDSTELDAVRASIRRRSDQLMVSRVPAGLKHPDAVSSRAHTNSRTEYLLGGTAHPRADLSRPPQLVRGTRRGTGRRVCCWFPATPRRYGPRRTPRTTS